MRRLVKEPAEILRMNSQKSRIYCTSAVKEESLKIVSAFDPCKMCEWRSCCLIARCIILEMVDVSLMSVWWLQMVYLIVD